MTETNLQLSEYEMKRYLYGEASDDEVVGIEDKIFVDDELFDQLTTLENNLVDQYVRGKLDGDELKRFEKSVERVPERKAKVANAIALQTYIQEERPLGKIAVAGNLKTQPVSSRFPFFRVFALGVAGIFLLLLIPFALLQYRSEPEVSRRGSSNSIKPSNLGSSNSNSGPRPSASATVVTNSTVISATLETIEKSEIQKIRIGKDTEQLSLKLLLTKGTTTEKESLWIKLNDRDLATGIFPKKENDETYSVTISVEIKDLAEKLNIITILGPSDKKIAQYNFIPQKQ